MPIDILHLYEGEGKYSWKKNFLCMIKKKKTVIDGYFWHIMIEAERRIAPCNITFSLLFFFSLLLLWFFAAVFQLVIVTTSVKCFLT